MGERHATFCEPYRMVNRHAPAHVGTMWSTDDERSHAHCACGWETSIDGADEAYQAWSDHARAAVSS